MQDENGAKIDFVLKPDSIMLFARCQVYPFLTSKFPKAVLYIDEHDGILLSCDSIKNWIQKDEFFSDETANLYHNLGFFGKASIAKVWLDATQTKKTDFEKILELSFQHLLSAHGEPLFDGAKHMLALSLKNTFS